MEDASIPKCVLGSRCTVQKLFTAIEPTVYVELLGITMFIWKSFYCYCAGR